MIVTCRIDERLIHGQIIATWLKSLSITHIVVANDAMAINEFGQKALKLAIPANVKCVIKSVNDAKDIVLDPRSESFRIMLITGNPEDALDLVKDIPSEINEINLANYGSITKPEIKNKATVSGMVYLDEEDIEVVNKLIESGKNVFTQKTPGDPKKVITRIKSKKLKEKVYV